jgi:hypothetical protein
LRTIGKAGARQDRETAVGRDRCAVFANDVHHCAGQARQKLHWPGEIELGDIVEQDENDMHIAARNNRLDYLNRERRRFTAANAQGRDAAALAMTLQRSDQGCDDPCARCPNRVAQRGSAAMHVHLVMRYA